MSYNWKFYHESQLSTAQMVVNRGSCLISTEGYSLYQWNWPVLYWLLIWQCLYGQTYLCSLWVAATSLISYWIHEDAVISWLHEVRRIVLVFILSMHWHNSVQHIHRQLSGFSRLAQQGNNKHCSSLKNPWGLSIDPQVEMSNFATEINIFTACF